jgi:hypothetical protein
MLTFCFLEASLLEAFVFVALVAEYLTLLEFFLNSLL